MGWTVLLAVFIGFAFLAGCESGYGQQTGSPPPAPEVSVVTIAPTRVDLTTTLPGRVAPFQAAEIRPQVNGIITKRFEEGTDVAAGQLLYQIDPASYKAAYASAQASLARSKTQLSSIQAKAERYAKLIKENVISRQDYDDATAALDQVLADIEYWKTAVDAARINLDYTRVIAPISGRIGRSSVTDGALAAAYQGAPLATIQQLDPVYVDVTQSSSELLRLRRSMEQGRLHQDKEGVRRVALLLEDGTAYAHEGTLQFAEVSVDPTTGSYTLRIVAPNPEHLLMPGMFVRAVILEGTVEQAILVPQQGVSRTPKGEPVALVVDETDTVQQRMLILDRAIGDKWLVTSGLALGERVVVEGQVKIRPGAKVRAVAFDDQTAADSPAPDTLSSAPAN
ncbi:MAG TPA: efflux RND transporter periplasmic adaptor subunit [Desulfonatronum sp.]|nr:efflux RND transporter periplasmic adaptor subunit [Desulfonatronum sp.]